MPDKKLTDSEIVKALEYWKEFDTEIDDMLMSNFEGDEMLIEQKEVVKITLELFDLINRLQEEKQNLEIELKAMRGAANSYKAENERLQEAIDEQDIEISRLYKRIDEAKAEAYKEFAERFENRILSILTTATLDEKDFVCTCIGINNNLLKELVGDNK